MQIYSILSTILFVAVGLISIACCAAENEPRVPVADFFKHDNIASATMSPSGKHVAAAIRAGPGNRRGLVVYDTFDMSGSKAIASYANADVVDINWVNDQLLVYSVYDLNQAPSDQRIWSDYTIERDGLKPPQKLLWGSPYAYLHDGSSDAIFARVISNPGTKDPSTNLFRINITTNEKKNITFRAPDSIRVWAMDRRGNPRVAIAHAGGKARMYWRAKADAEWTTAKEWSTYADEHESPYPMGVDDQNRLYIVARDDVSGDVNWLYRIDMALDPRKWQPIIALKGFDFNGSIVWGKQGDVLGIRHMTDAYSTTWLDKGMKEIQATIDKLLPATINSIACGECIERRKILVYSWSDRQPGYSTIFDTETKVVQMLGSERPWIKPNTMARREYLNFNARDGLTIPVHVTRPNGQKGPAPMVILVHGGPFIRGGYWQWNAESQFLASRGYVVVEPEFRGSAGFGFKHFRAGWKQWGLGMQDDIADATLWAIKQGYGDPKRVCIAGSSYGGYAALMGLVRYGELYQCAVSWAGATDIDDVYDARWNNLPERFKEFGMPLMVADQVKDAEQIRQTSPLRQAEKIKQPVLLAHGRDDYRIPIYSAVKMRKALEKNGTPVEWIQYRDEGHGWMLESTHVDFWTRVDTFLKKNTGAK